MIPLAACLAALLVIAYRRAWFPFHAPRARARALEPATFAVATLESTVDHDRPTDAQLAELPAERLALALVAAERREADRRRAAELAAHARQAIQA